MDPKNQAEQLLREGRYPSEIAGLMGITVSSVIQYLRLRVGEGALRLSDIYFSWSPEKREILQNAGRGIDPNTQLLYTNDMCPDDLNLFTSLRDTRVFRGDMYEYVSAVEVSIHRLVRARLECEFGPDEDGE